MVISLLKKFGLYLNKRKQNVDAFYEEVSFYRDCCCVGGE